MTFGRSQSQLVKSHHLTSCLQDPAAGTISYSQSANLWDNNIMSTEFDKHTFLQGGGGATTSRWILTLSLGMSWILTSSVTVPTTTAVLFSRPGIFILRIWLQWRQNQQFGMHKEVWTTELSWQGSYTFKRYTTVTILIRHDASRHWPDYPNTGVYNAI